MITLLLSPIDATTATTGQPLPPSDQMLTPSSGAHEGGWISKRNRSCGEWNSEISSILPVENELSGKIGAGGGGSGVVGGGREKRAEGGERDMGGVWKKKI
ncbi:hypothetical protein TIFTF001_052901 [Ficus carica]|uniref:Uncharacterized protein n=1 Tax=Ficus carica TaxID=3494 RepID=A0AA88JG52_FICCA|nr:hypothetical protein TIFTF001_052901 [Ficus carica]